MYKHEVTIRPAISNDAAAIAMLAQELTAFEGRTTLTTTETVVRDAFGSAPACRYLVAETEGKVIGMCMFYAGYDLQSAVRGLHLGDIIISKYYRGNGIGTQLFKQLCNVALHESYAWISWTLLANNSSAHNFYTKLGAIDVPVRFMAMGRNIMQKLAIA